MRVAGISTPRLAVVAVAAARAGGVVVDMNEVKLAIADSPASDSRSAGLPLRQLAIGLRLVGGLDFDADAVS